MDSSGLSTYGLNGREWEMSTPPTPQLGHGCLYFTFLCYLLVQSKSVCMYGMYVQTCVVVVVVVVVMVVVIVVVAAAVVFVCVCRHTCFVQEFQLLDSREEVILRLRGAPTDLEVCSSSRRRCRCSSSKLITIRLRYQKKEIGCFFVKCCV